RLADATIVIGIPGIDGIRDSVDRAHEGGKRARIRDGAGAAGHGKKEQGRGRRRWIPLHREAGEDQGGGSTRSCVSGRGRQRGRGRASHGHCPRKMVIVESPLATARSGRPSPLKSPTARATSGPVV